MPTNPASIPILRRERVARTLSRPYPLRGARVRIHTIEGPPSLHHFFGFLWRGPLNGVYVVKGTPQWVRPAKSSCSVWTLGPPLCEGVGSIKILRFRKSGQGFHNCSSRIGFLIQKPLARGVRIFDGNERVGPRVRFDPAISMVSWSGGHHFWAKGSSYQCGCFPLKSKKS